MSRRGSFGENVIRLLGFMREETSEHKPHTRRLIPQLKRRRLRKLENAARARQRRMGR